MPIRTYAVCLRYTVEEQFEVEAVSGSHAYETAEELVQVSPHADIIDMDYVSVKEIPSD